MTPEGPDQLAPAASILRKDAYFDTVRLYVENPITDDELNAIRPLVGHVKCLPSMPHQAWWGGGLVMHQPSAEALRYVAEEFSKIILTRVDMALDFVTAHKADAQDIQDYIERYFVQRWHGRKRLTRFETILYWGSKKSRNNLAIYSDKPSRIDGAPCCHFEWRVTSATALHAVGLNTIDDLLKFDHRSFWQKRIGLRSTPQTECELEQLGKAACGQPKRKKLWVKPYGRGIVSNVFLRTGYSLLRASAWEDQVKAQEALDALGHLGKRHFPELSSEWLLPDAAPPI